MNIFKNNLRKVVFFLSLSSLYCMFYNFYSILVFATDGGKSSMGNADVYKEVPYIAKYVIQWDFVLSSAGSLLYYICLGLVFLLNGVYTGITGIFDVIGKIFSDSPIAEFFKQFNVLIFPILTVSLGLYGLYAVFFGSKKIKPLAKGFVVVTGTLLFASSIISLMANTTQNVVSTISITDSKCGKLSFGSCIAKGYIVDVPYYASQKNENGNRNNIKTDQELFGLRYNEGIGPNYEYNGFKRDLNIPAKYDDDGNVQEALGLKSGDWWKLNSDFVSYQKWNVNFIGFLLNLIVVLFSFFGSGFRIGVNVFDGVLVSGLLPLIGSTDIGGGQKVKNAIKLVFVGFANIVLYMIAIKFFGEFVLMVNRLSVNWLSQIFLIGGASIAVFNLPQTMARIFNIAPPKDANILQRVLIADRLLNRAKRGFK